MPRFRCCRPAAFLPTLLIPILLLSPLATPAADPAPGVYDFEAGGPGSGHGQWSGGPTATLAADSVEFHGGRMSARIQRTPDSANPFSALSFTLPADREGASIELRGWLKSQDVVGSFGLWFREDGAPGVVAFKNMQPQALDGTTDWTEYTLTLPLEPEARTIIAGALLGGTGTVWADDFSLWIDGRPLAEAEKAARLITVLDTDTEFAGARGSPWTP